MMNDASYRFVSRDVHSNVRFNWSSKFLISFMWQDAKLLSGIVSIIIAINSQCFHRNSYTSLLNPLCVHTMTRVDWSRQDVSRRERRVEENFGGELPNMGWHFAHVNKYKFINCAITYAKYSLISSLRNENERERKGTSANGKNGRFHNDVELTWNEASGRSGQSCNMHNESFTDLKIPQVHFVRMYSAHHCPVRSDWSLEARFRAVCFNMLDAQTDGPLLFRPSIASTWTTDATLNVTKRNM